MTISSSRRPASGDESSAARRSHRATIAGLLLLWLVPRAAMAVKQDVICPDAVTYFAQARMLEGLGPTPLPAEHFNLYPAILAGLHQLGIDHETAGRWWGVFCGSLIVVPLYFWIRRQFDDRTAIVACALVGLHPKSIEWSAQLVRDPTFCLFAACALYAGFRAATERSIGWFAAAGAAIFLATQTRIEGWFLLLPIAVWTVSESDRSWRTIVRTLAGWTVLAAVYPLMLLPINAKFGANVDGPIIGGNLVKIEYLRHAPLVQNLFREPIVGSAASPSLATPVASPTSTTATAARPERVTVVSATEMTLRAMIRGISPLYGLLVCVGLVVGRRRWLTWQQQAAFAYFAASLLAVWLHVWESGMTTSRYALTPVIVAAPYAALGCLAVANFAATKVRRLRGPLLRAAAAFRVPLQHGAVAGLLLVFGLATFVDSFVTQSVEYGVDRSIGLWLKEHAGPHRSLAGAGHFVVAGYYAKAEPFYRPAAAETPAAMIARCAPDVVLLETKQTSRTAVDAWLASDPTVPYRSLPQESLPLNCRSKVIVLVREVRQARGDATERR
jgi:hypothetical protein